MAVIDSAAAAPAALARGATLIQLRMPGSPARALEKEARALVPTAVVPVLVGSRADVALAVGAIGVHLPEADIPVAAARRLLGDRLVGRSVHSLAAARQAAEEGADYVVFGPIYESSSHPGRSAVGVEALREVCAAVRLPVLAIGGVAGDRIEECRAAGAAGFAGIQTFKTSGQPPHPAA
ncbi:MAG TPA: thiamine phosphate synthase [Candidatus Dormibacteraeota bacterium]